MTSIPRFDTAVHCEEVFTIDPQEMAEVLAAPAVEDDWQGYTEWSREVEAAPSVLSVNPKTGKVEKKPEPPSLGRIGGIEL